MSEPTRVALRWPTVRRALTWIFFAAVLTLLVTQGRKVDWAEVGRTLAGYQTSTLAIAVMLAVASHALYGLFDQIGRDDTGHRLPRLRVATIAFVSYAFNLNMGSLIGGIGFRYRLYSRFGLDAATITRITGLSIAANWLGYALVAGTVFATRSVSVPPGWEVGTDGLQWIGFGLLAFSLSYLLASAFLQRRRFTVRGHRIELPCLRIALLQMAVSVVNWLLIGTLVWLLIAPAVAWPTVLGVLLVSAVAGVLTHVPAGLGVLELVFITLLGHQVGQGELIAALLAYRAVYYLLPLLPAIGVYLKLEAQAKRSATDAPFRFQARRLPAEAPSGGADE